MTGTDQTTAIGKLRPEVKEKWVAALRSGEYKQGRSYLHSQNPDGEDRFCCLGVLCELAVQEGRVAVNQEGQAAGGVTAFYYGNSISYPDDSLLDWAYEVKPDEFHTW